MPFQLMPLPYEPAALEPIMSRQTLELHHGKHHAGYVKKLNELIGDGPLAKLSLPEIIQNTAGDEKAQAIFNNAGQVWNHDFFWRSMMPRGGGEPIDSELRRKIDADFGSYDNFRDVFVKTATSRFGSGWAWLALDDGKLTVLSTANAASPLVSGGFAILACDVWEHAYYLDYQNRREEFVHAFLDKLVNWSFAAEQFALQGEGSASGARSYQDDQARFARSGRVAGAARNAARALDSEEGNELEQARQATARRRKRG